MNTINVLSRHPQASEVNASHNARCANTDTDAKSNVANDGSFFAERSSQITDWENALDMMHNPTIEQLRTHLSSVPPEEARSSTAIWLENYIKSQSN